jgi:hypothetical protein
VQAPADGEVVALSGEDKALLSKFVNPVYLKDDASLKVTVGCRGQGSGVRGQCEG